MKMRCKKARKNISLALDSRLQTAVSERLQAHLDVCPACRDWQKGQVWLLGLMKTTQAPPRPSPGFYAVIRDKINNPHGQKRYFTFSPSSFRPALLRAAMLLIMVFSAWVGLSLGNRLDAPAAAETADAVFKQTMNLDVFADLPADSFGAVYERLLQGELQ
ncbi:MAG: zf-HC2 domain-containing protein [Candidatus Aminicenantes bacterium]|nr:zf-HC2 domain-containing protein [Candidatus Aminicenantes bacterium]